jgi:hypothetical protein
MLGWMVLDGFSDQSEWSWPSDLVASEDENIPIDEGRLGSFFFFDSALFFFS